MNFDQTRIQELFSRLTESLNVEVKCWISPDEPSGIAKIVRAVLALRNRNGGVLVIGFDDKTLQPDNGHEPEDVHALFHIDKIQGIISDFSSELFEVAVAFGEFNGQEYPIIVIPEGIRTPVAAKRDLFEDPKKRLICRGDVYFRTLASNGTPSTAPARPEDWRDIIEICFDNREADIGRFLRRQLAGHDVASLVSTLSQWGLAQNIPSVPTLREHAEALLNDGEKRFQEALKERSPTPESLFEKNSPGGQMAFHQISAFQTGSEEKSLVEVGSWSVALIIDPPHAQKVPDRIFLTTLASSNPRYTGWPIWLDSSRFRDQRNAPKVKDRAWEALIFSSSDHLDFSRIDPKGEFFLRRALQDDSTNKVEPGTALDPILVLIRVAEAIAVGLAFAKALGWEEESTRLGFAFRWTKLAKRALVSWENPLALFISGPQAHDNEIITFTELSLDTPASAIAPFVEQATQDLFALFDGYNISSEAVEAWTRKLVERRL